MDKDEELGCSPSVRIKGADDGWKTLHVNYNLACLIAYVCVTNNLWLAFMQQWSKFQYSMYN